MFLRRTDAQRDAVNDLKEMVREGKAAFEQTFQRASSYQRMISLYFT